MALTIEMEDFTDVFTAIEDIYRKLDFYEKDREGNFFSLHERLVTQLKMADIKDIIDHLKREYEFDYNDDYHWRFIMELFSIGYLEGDQYWDYKRKNEFYIVMDLFGYNNIYDLSLEYINQAEAYIGFPLFLNKDLERRKKELEEAYNGSDSEI